MWAVACVPSDPVAILGGDGAPAMNRGGAKPAFERMEASLLACPKCKRAVAVRKRLLLILPEGDKYEYVCPHCSSTCGTTVQTQGERRLLV